jgi:Tfp pilus assembly protein PilF
MKCRLSLPTDPARRRRLAIWAACGLAVVGLAAVVSWLVVWPALELEAAERALRRNDPAAARGYLDRYLARRPGDGRALLLGARAARRADANADAERLLTAAEQAAGTTDDSRLEWALLGAQQGDFAGEEDRLRSAVDRNHPDAVLILEALAKGYDAAYRWPEAVGALGKLLELDPDHVPARLLRGTIADRIRRPETAEEDFRRAVDLAPDSAAAHIALAGLLARRGHTREAIAHYELALKSRPADPAVRIGLARTLVDNADPAGAERQLDEVLAADPDHADALVERGRLALRQKRPAEAEPFLARAVRAAPWHREGLRLHVAALKELGRSEEAARCEARIAELTAEDGISGRLRLHARDNPGDTAVRWDLWQWSLRNGQEAEGFAWLTEILRAAPKDARANAALADHFERAGQPRRAALHRVAAGPPPG